MRSPTLGGFSGIGMVSQLGRVVAVGKGATGVGAGGICAELDITATGPAASVEFTALAEGTSGPTERKRSETPAPRTPTYFARISQPDRGRWIFVG